MTEDRKPRLSTIDDAHMTGWVDLPVGADLPGGAGWLKVRAMSIVSISLHVMESEGRVCVELVTGQEWSVRASADDVLRVIAAASATP